MTHSDTYFNVYIHILMSNLSHVASDSCCQAKGRPGLVGMRSVFWTHIREAQGRLAQEHPDASKTKILEMARAEFGSHLSNLFVEIQGIQHYPINHMFQGIYLSPSLLGLVHCSVQGGRSTLSESTA